MKRIIALVILSVYLFSGCALGLIYDTETTYDIQELTQDAVDISKSWETTSSVSAANGDNTSGDVTESENSTQAENNSQTDENRGIGYGNPEFDIGSVPEFSGEPFYVINNNEPTFSASELSVESYEFYSELDSLGRCGVTIASIGRDIMPTEDRGSIGSVKPTGWHTVKYDTVDGKYLYNRCHLIGFQLTGENANTKNLITGTRYLNVEGMLPFENMVADYVKETGNHVALRVTPVFEGNNLLASGVQMEGYSIEDEGDGICFNIFCYNAQPGIDIDYRDGSSSMSESSRQEESSEPEESSEAEATKYVLNTNTKKFHKETCRHVDSIKDENYAESTKTRDGLIDEGYSPCGTCKP